MLPSDERLHADDRARRERHDRLVVEDELAALDGAADVDAQP